MQMPIVLINVFEVVDGMEREFVAWWEDCSEALRHEPGFIDARLHRSLQSGSRFQFINIAHWESAAAFEQARDKNKAFLRPTAAGKGYPAVYEVAEVIQG